MKKIILISFLSFILVHNANSFEKTNENIFEWKAGVARVLITPDESMWMAGYAFRDHSSEGRLDELWAKALALEDANKQKVVLVTMDLLGIPKNISNKIRDRLEKKFGLSRAQIILNSSHTHSGPVLQNALVDIYPLDSQERKKIKQYSGKLEDQIVNLVGEALKSMAPAKLYAENGVTRFQVNRRNNNRSILHRQTKIKGPSDYAVPVLKVVNETGDLIAVAFGYACHPVVLSNYRWSGDYVGYAQRELEKTYPGVTALFFQGAGADQNPQPRGSIEFAKQYGQSLAAAVERVLSEDMRQLSSHLSTAYSEVDLTLASPPGKKTLSRFIRTSSGYQKRWAKRMLDKLNRGEALKKSYPYPVQIWQLGDQLMISLGGELVVDYAIELKRIFGQNAFILGYSNDVMAYIPSNRILREGGYEGKLSQMVYGLPSSWTANIEILILHEIIKLAEQTGIPLSESKLIEN